ncbi:unnamed protein product [Allacma fusca]|uniref:C2H2-type domain-containing protein n=1 Tax=Allacma fusca TaxID=39272 RepID=A0A8J2KZR2_9HEXA|nr:unnamed protein product [Allacma fusca]
MVELVGLGEVVEEFRGGQVVGRPAIGEAGVVGGAVAVGVAGLAEVLVEFGVDEVDGRVAVREVVRCERWLDGVVVNLERRLDGVRWMRRLMWLDAAIEVGGCSEDGEAVGAVEMAGGAEVGATGRAKAAGRTEATGLAEAGRGTVHTCMTCGRASRSRSAKAQHLQTH